MKDYFTLFLLGAIVTLSGALHVIIFDTIPEWVRISMILGGGLIGSGFAEYIDRGKNNDTD